MQKKKKGRAGKGDEWTGYSKEEMERIRLAEEKGKAEQKTEMNENVRGGSILGAVR